MIKLCRPLRKHFNLALLLITYKANQLFTVREVCHKLGPSSVCQVADNNLRWINATVGCYRIFYALLDLLSHTLYLQFYCFLIFLFVRFDIGYLLETQQFFGLGLNRKTSQVIGLIK